MLPPLGAQVAASTSCSSSSSGTGSGFSRRIARIVAITSRIGASVPTGTAGAATRETLSVPGTGGPPRVLARPVELVPDDPPVAEAIEVPQIEVRLELARPSARVPDQADERGVADDLALEHLDPVLLPRLGQHLVLAANRLPVRADVGLGPALRPLSGGLGVIQLDHGVEVVGVERVDSPAHERVEVLGELVAHRTTTLTSLPGTTTSLTTSRPSTCACTFGAARHSAASSSSVARADASTRSRTFPLTWQTSV